jgi:hypothetical protein
MKTKLTLVVFMVGQILAASAGAANESVMSLWPVRLREWLADRGFLGRRN